MNYVVFRNFQMFGFWEKIEIKIYTGYKIILYSLSESSRI